MAIFDNFIIIRSSLAFYDAYGTTKVDGYKYPVYHFLTSPVSLIINHEIPPPSERPLKR